MYMHPFNIQLYSERDSGFLKIHYSTTSKIVRKERRGRRGRSKGRSERKARNKRM